MQEVIPVVPGGRVRYVDPVGHPYNALVTAVHGDFGPYDFTPEQIAANPHLEALQGQPRGSVPVINVVFVEADASKHDPYGNQIDRATSVSHHSGTQAHGRYWENA